MATETANQEQELRTEAITLHDRAVSIAVFDQGSYNEATSILSTVKTLRKRWAEYWSPVRDGAYKSYKAILNKISEGDVPLEEAEMSLKRAILKFDTDQRILQEKRQREAQEKAEADEAARRAQLAFEMEESGAEEADIEQVVSAPIVAVAPPVQTYQKASGISTRDNWCIEIVDLKKLLRLIVSGKLKIPAEDATKLTDVLESILKPRAVSDKETLNLDGCRAVNRKIVAGRTK
jgi:hypothetical protein